MTFFKYFTPVTYWLLVVMWSFIFIFYFYRLKFKKANNRLIFTLLLILAIDAFRTLFESAYFGLWYTSLVGFLPTTIYTFLVRPEIVFIPKALNVIAAIMVIAILICRWIPQEESEKHTLNVLIDEKTKELTKGNVLLQQEIQEHKQTAIELMAKTKKLSDTVEKLETEIDARKKVARDLRENEEYLRALLEAADNVAFVVTDLAGENTRILDISSGAEKIFGYDKNEVVGKKVSIFHPAETVKHFPELQTELKKKQKGYSGETTLLRKNGDAFPALFTIYPKRNASGELVGTIGVSIDISNLKKAEEAIINQKRLFETMFNTIPDGVVITDDKRVVKLANKGMKTTFGYQPEELAGKSTKILYADNKKYQKAGETVFAEKTQKTKDLYVTRYKDKSGREFSGETFGAKLFDENNKWIGNLGIMRDITERETAEQRIQQAYKMEAIGTLAGGIAHDFNNLLSAIIGYTELALGATEKGSQLEDDLKEVHTAGIRAKDLVKQILTFARQTDDSLKPVQIKSIVKEAVKFIKSTIPSTIAINDNILSDSWIMGSPTQIHQVMMNLCTNAAHAMEENGGTLDVSVTDTTIETNSIPDLKPGEYMEIKISDTGMGIPPEHLQNIFEPYFTTKPIGEGTGMGLAVVHGIVKNYGGHISVDSMAGKGTCFTIYLPITENTRADNPDEKEIVSFGNEKILFIDDEASIAKMGCKILEQLGYTVTTTTSSVEALELFRSNPKNFDLIISDMTMPEMTGDVLAVELMKARHDIPVILCTGYSKKISQIKADGLGIKAIAYKPIVKAELARIVRRVLDEAKASPHA